MILNRDPGWKGLLFSAEHVRKTSGRNILAKILALIVVLLTALLFIVSLGFAEQREREVPSYIYNTPGPADAYSEYIENEYSVLFDGLSEQHIETFLPSLEWEILEMVNVERVNEGLQPLQMDSLLRDDLARAHSKDMGDYDFYEHTSPNTGTFGDRIKDCLTDRGILWSTAGENLNKFLLSSAEAAMYGGTYLVDGVNRNIGGWMDSEGHRANILNPDYNYTGIGVYHSADGQRSYTQVFIGADSPPSEVITPPQLITLGDLEIGDRVVDLTWGWEFRYRGNYGPGDGDCSRPVTWIVVAKDYYGEGSGVTLISEELIGSFTYDDSTNRGSLSGSGHWGDSGTDNATRGLRPWLNSTGNQADEGFYHAFSNSFKDNTVTVTLPNETWDGEYYETEDNVFIPSRAELFSFGNRGAFLNGSEAYYWTRTPLTRDDYTDGRKSSTNYLVGSYGNILNDT